MAGERESDAKKTAEELIEAFASVVRAVAIFGGSYGPAREALLAALADAPSASALLAAEKRGLERMRGRAARAVENMPLPGGGSRSEERVVVAAAKVIRALSGSAPEGEDSGHA